LLAAVIWTVYLWTLATPTLRDRNGLLKGTDFLHFYTLGSLALEHRGRDLYDMGAQSTIAGQRVPEAGRMVYVPLYGPQVSLLFMPLASLPYAVALALWLVTNVVIYALCCYAIWRTCPGLQNEKLTVFILAAGYPALIHLLAWGQTSGIALGCFTAAYLALRTDRLFLAGLAIGCLAFKPQLGLASAVVFLFAWKWKVIGGTLTTAIAQLAAGWLYYGRSVMLDYFQHLMRVQGVFSLLEPRPYQMHSLRSFWAMLVPSSSWAFVLYLISTVFVLWMTVRFWRSSAALGLRFSVLLLATVLVSPHLTVYDLVILAPAFLLIAGWVTGHASEPKNHFLGLLLYASYLAPLIGPLSQWTRIQISVPAFVALLWIVIRISGVPRATDSQYLATA
jgi:hypothetical protein